MSNSDKLCLARDDNNRSRSKEVDRDRYQWYNQFLPPIPTLRNAKCGDGTRALGDEPPADLGEPDDFAAALLSPEMLERLEEIAREHQDATTIQQQVQNEQIFASRLEASSETRGLLFGDYDAITGVPDPEVPPLLTYVAPRALFARSSGNVNKDLVKENKPLETTADYQRYYDAFLKDSQSRFLVGNKVFGFTNLNEIYANDEIFGWQRLAGTNPRVIQRLTPARLDALLKKMPLEDKHVAQVAGPGATIALEIEKNRLYVCDYWLLDGIPLQEGRHLAAAIGIFWSDGRNRLLPVAIQLGQKPGRVRVPGEEDWEIARTMFAIADFNYHEMGTHLCEAHFSQEAFMVATRRNLPKAHPIGALLVEIYWGLLFNNALGRLKLVNPGGPVDQMMAGKLKDGSLRVVCDYYKKVWSWDDWNLEKYLEKQGMTDTTALPVYPYRDDGLPMWRAIRAFADQYVGAYYNDASDVAQDAELQAWLGELLDPDKGNLGSKGFPQTLANKESLAEVLARLIWQAGPGHAGINYSQYQHFAVVPNSPGAAYATEGPLMKVLPPVDKAVAQVDVLNVITQGVFGRIGEFEKSFLNRLNPQATNAVTNYQRALQTCGVDVDQRNKQYPRSGLKYVFLHPSNVPNSTNI